MGRKASTTVDYFPHYTKFGQTLFILEERWGNDGYAFWFKLLQFLGAAPGHAFDCSNTPQGRENWEYLYTRARLPGQKCAEIISWLADRGNLDKELWELRRILWCQDFINNLAEAYSKRTCKIPERPNLKISSPRNPPQQDIRAGNDAQVVYPGNLSTEGLEGEEGGMERISGPEIPPSPPSATPEKESSTKVYSPPPDPLAQLRTVNPSLVLSNGDREGLAELIAREPWETILAAYRVQQGRYPGKGWNFFVKDFAAWRARIPRASTKHEYPPQAPPPARTAAEEAEVAEIAEKARQTIFRGAKVPAPEAPPAFEEPEEDPDADTF